MGLRVPTTRLGRVDGVIAYGTEQRSFGLSFMAAIEGTADVRNRAGRLVVPHALRLHTRALRGRNKMRASCFLSHDNPTYLQRTNLLHGMSRVMVQGCGCVCGAMSAAG
jgi:hypothetical protein